MAAVQQFLSLTDDLICVLDEFGYIQEVNGNWKRTLDLPPGKDVSLLEMIAEESGDERLKYFLGDKRLSVMRIPSCRLKDFSGNSFWVDFKIRRIPSQNKYWCLIRDISKKHHNLEVLEQISETCNLGHWEYNSSNNTLHWSKKIFQILHVDESITPSIALFRGFFSAEDAKKIDQLKGGRFEFTFKVMINDQVKWIFLKGSKEVFPTGDYAVQGILQDITMDTRKEDAQLSSNIELSSFQKGLDQFSIVARTDARGRIIQANEEFCRISKYSEEELLGKDHRLLNSGHHPRAFFEEMWNCIKNGKNWRGEIKNKAKDGSYYWVDTIIIPIKDNHARLIEILSFRFEITKLKELELKNQILQNQLDLLLNNTAWAQCSYDFGQEKMSANSLMMNLLGLSQIPSFEDFLSLLDKEDQLALLRCLQDTAKVEFKTSVQLRSQELILHLKLMRNSRGEVQRFDCIGYRKLERPKLASFLNFQVKNVS